MNWLPAGRAFDKLVAWSKHYQPEWGPRDRLIAHLKGILLSKKSNQVIVDVQGVGYELNVSLSTYYTLGEEGDLLSLPVYTHVREDAIVLYGFRAVLEKELFLHLINVTGVGPKVAMALLSGASVEELIQAIRANDWRRLMAIPGVGRKTAERIILELKEKMGKLAVMAEPPPMRERARMKEDVISALFNLGYPRQAAEKAVSGILEETSAVLDFESALKRALQVLAG